MQGRKSNTKLQIIFSAIMLMLVFVIELYVMMNLSDQFIVIGLLGLLLLVCLYILLHALMAQQVEKDARREEQYDSIFKSEKATYLMLKKSFEELETKLDIIEKASKVPTEEIVGTQKGIGKVIINRSRENAEAIMSSNDLVMESMESLKDTIASNNDSLLESYKSISEDSVQKMIQKQQDMLMSLKDMEIRLNNAIMQSQKMVAAAQPVYAPPVMSAPSNMTAVPDVQPEITIPQSDSIISEEPVIPDFAPSFAEEPIVEEVPEAAIEPELETIIEPEPVVEPEPVAEPVIDLSDPGKKLGDDEIAALFASMSQDMATMEEKAAEEVPEPVIEEAAPQPVVESEPAATTPAVDLSDPNKKLGDDEIAALFASMSQEVTESAPESEPVVEPEPAPAPAVDLSDPNKQLSPDEIAALFASMTS